MPNRPDRQNPARREPGPVSTRAAIAAGFWDGIVQCVILLLAGL